MKPCTKKVLMVGVVVSIALALVQIAIGSGADFQGLRLSEETSKWTFNPFKSQPLFDYGADTFNITGISGTYVTSGASSAATAGVDVRVEARPQAATRLPPPNPLDLAGSMLAWATHNTDDTNTKKTNAPAAQSNGGGSGGDETEKEDGSEPEDAVDPMPPLADLAAGTTETPMPPFSNVASSGARTSSVALPNMSATAPLWPLQTPPPTWTPTPKPTPVPSVSPTTLLPTPKPTRRVLRWPTFDMALLEHSDDEQSGSWDGSFSNEPELEAAADTGQQGGDKSSGEQIRLESESMPTVPARINACKRVPIITKEASHPKSPINRVKATCEYPTSANDILVGVWHSKGTEHRLRWLLDSWYDPDKVVFLGQYENSSRCVPIVGSDADADDFLSTLTKGLVGLQKMFDEHPHKKWFVVLGDDTYVVLLPPSVRLLVALAYEPTPILTSGS